MSEHSIKVTMNHPSGIGLKPHDLDNAVYFDAEGYSKFGSNGREVYGSFSLDRLKDFIKQAQALVEDIDSRVEKEPTWEDRVRDARDGSVIRYVCGDKYYFKINGEWTNRDGRALLPSSFNEFANEFIKEVKK